MSSKEELYKYIKIGGLLSSLPFVLASGPIIGYFIGDYLKNKFSLGNYVIFIFLAIGFIFSLKEAIKIILMLIKIEKKSANK